MTWRHSSGCLFVAPAYLICADVQEPFGWMNFELELIARSRTLPVSYLLVRETPC